MKRQASVVNKLNQSGAAPRGQSMICRRNLLKLGGALAVGTQFPWLAALTDDSLGFDWVLSNPEAAGMSADGIDGIRKALQQQIDDGTINGVVSAVVRHDKLVWYEAQGYRDPIAGTPMRKDDIFRMMSSTKPVTAVAVLTLLDEGKLSLEDPVSCFIPSFNDQRVVVVPGGVAEASEATLVPAEREVTIKDLLTHTSGITSVQGDPARNAAASVSGAELTPEDTLATWAPKIGSAPLDFQPGSKFAYSPTDAWDVLLRIVEIVSGETADVYMHEHLFQPLDMCDTYFNVPTAKQDRVVDIISRAGDEWQKREHRLGPGPGHYARLSGGGGLYSTVHDFINFELMLLHRGHFNGHRILQPETVDLMTANQVGTLFEEWIPPITAGNGFGLGVRIVEDPANARGRSVGAFGWGGAYGTETWAEPARDLVAAMFLQMNPPPWTPSTEFQLAVQRAVGT